MSTRSKPNQAPAAPAKASEPPPARSVHDTSRYRLVVSPFCTGEKRENASSRRRRGLCEVCGRVLQLVYINPSNALMRCSHCGIDVIATRPGGLYRLAKQHAEQQRAFEASP